MRFRQARAWFGRAHRADACPDELFKLACDSMVQLNDIGIKALPLDKLLVDYLCQGYAITGPLDHTGALSFAAADMWNTLSGPGTLRAGPGKVVGSQALALVSGVVRVGGAISAALNAPIPETKFGIFRM